MYVCVFVCIFRIQIKLLNSLATTEIAIHYYYISTLNDFYFILKVFSAMGAAQCCAYLLTGLFVIITSAILGTLYFRFHHYFTTLSYISATCVVSKTVYTVQYACDCGIRCRSAYPCLLIYAKLNDTSDGTKLEWPIPLYDDDWQQVYVTGQWDSDMVERVSRKKII